MLNRRPWGPLCWILAFFTASYQQLLWSPKSIGVPEGPLGRVWLSLQHLVYNSDSNCNCNCHLTSILTELYNSSAPTRLPTRSLEWHDWSSSSGNNSHVVHRSLSSGASVYECIMGFSFSHFISQIHPRDLFRLLAIGICYFLPVHHFVMACLLGPKVKIQHFFIKNISLTLYSRKGWCFCGVWEMGGETYTQREDFSLYLLSVARACQRLHPLASSSETPLICCESHIRLRFSALCLNLTARFSSCDLLPVTHLLYPSALFTNHNVTACQSTRGHQERTENVIC